MTVQELIEKLKTLNPNTEVVIEENHCEYYPIQEDRIYKETLTKNYYHASDEELDKGLNVIVIRA